MTHPLLSVVGRYPTLVALYTILGLQAFVFQTFIRLQMCAGIGACAVSLAKGAVWSVIWPIYWFGYFVLF
jgi:hypothetical protein